MRAIIGDQIRKLREARKITQEEIAEKLSMTRQRFARIEKGHSDISYDIILSIAEIFSIDPHDITDVCSIPVSISYRNGDASVETFDTIKEMIGFFYANKSMYVQMNSESDDVI